MDGTGGVGVQVGMGKAAQQIAPAVDAAPMRAPDGLHPVEGLPRVIRVEIVKFMGPQLRTGPACWSW